MLDYKVKCLINFIYNHIPYIMMTTITNSASPATLKTQKLGQTFPSGKDLLYNKM